MEHRKICNITCALWLINLADYLSFQNDAHDHVQCCFSAKLPENAELVMRATLPHNEWIQSISWNTTVAGTCVLLSVWCVYVCPLSDACVYRMLDPCPDLQLAAFPRHLCHSLAPPLWTPNWRGNSLWCHHLWAGLIKLFTIISLIMWFTERSDVMK